MRRRPPNVSQLHQDWLAQVETDGPFLSLPVLKDIWPNGMDQRVLLSGLIEGLGHDHTVIRAGAADALGQLGPAAKAAVPALIAATKDKARFVRESAAEALQEIDPEALERGSEVQ